jgi:glucose/arabinose dehydrogenase
MLVTLKEGAMRVVSPDGTVGADIAGLPKVAAEGQGGLLDVALAPDYATSKQIFFSFSEPREGGNGTSVASAKLALNEKGGGTLEDVKVIFRQMPTYDGDKHFGSRLVFGASGELFVTVGERSDAAVRAQAQEIASGLGKAGSPLTAQDLARTRARDEMPLRVAYRDGEHVGLRPPTQGITTLEIMGILDRFNLAGIPEGSADAYTAAELESLNAVRKSTQRFAPYE